jgi:GntR family transcriptional regulator
VEQSLLAFHLDPTSGVPTYLQLVQQVKHAVRYGMLRPGDQLPTARQVVEALAINPNTVLKAYRELEREGFAHGRPGAGTFIAAGAPRPLERAIHAPLRRSLERWLRQAHAAGLDRDGVTGLFAMALQQAFEREEPNDRSA